MMIRRFTLLVLFAMFPVVLGAQPVQWETFTPQSPFMLFQQADLGTITTKITQTEDGKTLYAQIVQQSTARSDNQRQRARIAKSAAFVLALGRDASGDLTPHARGELDQTVRTYLGELDPTVQTNNSEYQWRAIELGQFCQAYDTYKSQNGPLAQTEADLADFAQEAADQLVIPLQVHNNLSAKLAAGVGMAALILKDAQDAAIRQRTGEWLALALDFIHATYFENHSAPDGRGGYSEGPYYLRYGMMSILPLFMALHTATGGNDIDIGGTTYPNPVTDPRYRDVFEWAANMRMPDGRMPAFEDTYMDTHFPELAALAPLLPDGEFFAWPNSDGLSPFPAASLFSHMAETYDFRIEYLTMADGTQQVPEGYPATRHMPDAGYSVLRSSWAPDATYFAMIGKHGKARTGGSAFGSGHKHANETGFVLFSGGELLAMEPGYYQYDFRDSLIYGMNHNIVLVDGKGPDRTSLFNFMIGVDAFIEDTLTGQWGATSSVRTTYENTDIRRTAVLLDDMFVVLRDEATSTSPHTFTHQVHGNGLDSSGTFALDAANGIGTWHGSQMKLDALVGAVDATPSYEAIVRKHAPTYRVFEDHSAMYSSVQGNAATFFTLLLPSADGVNVSINPLQSPQGVYAVSGTDGTRPFAAGINTTGAPFEIETIVGRAETDAAITAVANDGAFGFQLFLEHATEFTLAAIPLIRTDNPATMVGYLTYDLIEATVTGENLRELSLFLSYEPDTVLGTGFSSYTMQGNRLVMHIPTGRADFRITLTSVPTSASPPDVADGFHVAPAYPNPVSGPITIPFTAGYSGPIVIVLYSTLGEEVYRTERSVNPGTNSITFSTPPKLSGPFLLKVTHHGGVSTQPLILR